MATISVGARNPEKHKIQLHWYYMKDYNIMLDVY